MPLDFPAIQRAALDLKQHQGVDRLLRFSDFGGTITPPSDDPQDWWEPDTLTHRAELLGICRSGCDSFAALAAWINAAQTGSVRNRRATDGRPDCPYNGQGIAPGALDTPAA